VVQHVVLGNARAAGGQWVDDSNSASSKIGTLSYADMLSLPAYSFRDHWERTHDSPMPEFWRPSREEVADYYAVYPKMVGIADSVRVSQEVGQVTRSENGFSIGSHRLHCKHLVLASGIFTENSSPPPLLEPLMNLHSPKDPLLVIGSGFSAADVVISAPPSRKIIHVFNWAPDTRPSPLRGCHNQAYPGEQKDFLVFPYRFD
jgi:cation diffusion facilitator CzcD-associated flavoprotein CzcO